jgi:hypothetical protein
MSRFARGDYVKIEMKDEATGESEWMWVKNCDHAPSPPNPGAQTFSLTVRLIPRPTNYAADRLEKRSNKSQCRGAVPR